MSDLPGGEAGAADVLVLAASAAGSAASAGAGGGGGPGAGGSGTLLPLTVALGVLLVVLLLAAAAISGWGRLGHGRAVLGAGARAIAQLAVVSALITQVVGSVPLTLAFVLVMFAVATRTAGRRITPGRAWVWAGVPIAAGVAPVLLLMAVAGVLPTRGIAVLPVAGILIGGALTATSMAGRRSMEDLRLRHGEVEAALALGLLDRDARLEIARPAAASALMPALDQTRTVGLVTLPGAFVGMLLGGASPVEAGAVQVFVLIALLAVEAVCVLVTLELVARGRFGSPRDGSPARGVRSRRGGR
ncbi:ABC transporter permease [Allostreptomyces psammosilenae]|uniref:Putative ABC transport system permease protein n=1 Tax=Allostreptomyces psammosilenae TaxID=1892865 RepID=A0A852ZZ45_9ACTN|nr:ABC transporter permease [Allostreptomyces psammosilenae]NYI03388.1 putative ABC transport system permease protein [Allostreptomyces psammosilenae]